MNTLSRFPAFGPPSDPKNRPFLPAWPLALACLPLLVAASLASPAPVDSPPFTLDTRSSPVSLDPARTLAGDVSGDKRIGLDDFLLLSQYVEGTRGLGDPLIADPAAADATGSGTVNQNDVRQVGQWLLGAASEPTPRATAAGFLIGMIEPASAKPGSLVQITVTGEVAENIRVVRFGSQLSPVVGQIDEHRVTVAVPYLPEGPVQVHAMVDAWETPGHPFVIEPLPVLASPPGEFTGRVFDSIGTSMEEFKRIVVPDLVALEVFTPGKSQDFISTINLMLLLLGEANDAIGDLPAAEKTLLDSLLYSGEINEALMAFEAELASLSGPTGMRDRAFGGPYDWFYYYVALDALSAKLGQVKLQLDAGSLVAVASGVGAAAAPFLVLGSVAISIVKNAIEGFIPTDIARLRATFSDGSTEFFIDQQKELFFLGDFRTETDPLQSTLGAALDGVFGGISLAFPGSSSILSEILKKASSKATQAGITSVYDNLLLNHIDLESWHYDVRVPISFYTPTAQGLAQRSLAYLPASVYFVPNFGLVASSAFVTRMPSVEHSGSTAPAVLNTDNGIFTPQAHGSGFLHYDAFNFRKAESFLGKVGTLAQAYPQRISDSGYNPFTTRFQPPAPSPQAQSTILSMSFKVQAATVLVRPNLTSATWSISGDRSLSGSGNQDFYIRPGTYTITWGNLSGYNKPANETLIVPDGGTITFFGAYSTENGTLQVRPSLSSASWTVTGPSNNSDSGTGNADLSVPPGTYTVTWGNVSGYNTPSPSTVSVTSGGTSTATGTYSTQSGTLQVRPSLSSASWTVEGPDNYSRNGSGERDLPVAPGAYTVFWGVVVGYNAPGATVVSINDGETKTAAGDYTVAAGNVKVRTNLSTAGWLIADGQGFTLNGTGNSDVTIGVGSYYIAWDQYDDDYWNVPPESFRIDFVGQEVELSGTYMPRSARAPLEDGDDPFAPQGEGDTNQTTNTTEDAVITSTGPVPARDEHEPDGLLPTGDEDPAATDPIPQTPMLPPVIAGPDEGPQPTLVRVPRASRMNDPDFSHLEALIDLQETVVLGSTPLPDPLAIGAEVTVTFSLTVPDGVLGAFGYELFYDPEKIEIAGIEQVAGSPYAASLVSDIRPGRARVAGARPQRSASDGQSQPAFVVRMRRLADGVAPTMRLRPLGLLDADLLHAGEAVLVVQAGASLGGTPLPPGPLADLYEAWAAANLPAHERAHYLTSAVFGVNNLLAFALGWDATDPNTWRQPAVAAVTRDGIWLHTRRRAGLPDLAWTWMTSTDLDTWVPASIVENRRVPLTGGMERWEIRVPADRPAAFFRLQISPGNGLPAGELSDRYDTWAAGQLPPDERAASMISSVFGANNLLAFALGWDAADPATRRQPALAERDDGGIWLHTRRRAGLPGLSWTWRSASD